MIQMVGSLPQCYPAIWLWGEEEMTELLLSAARCGAATGRVFLLNLHDHPVR